MLGLVFSEMGIAMRRILHALLTPKSLLAVILVSALVGYFVNRVQATCRASVNATKTHMTAIKTGLLSYEMRHDSFPTTRQGLQALVACPSGVDATRWRKFMEKVPLDARGRQFKYRVPSRHGMDFDLVSAGPDGKFGSKDDITNWLPVSQR